LVTISFKKKVWQIWKTMLVVEHLRLQYMPMVKARRIAVLSLFERKKEQTMILWKA
jgi:hypothetical protein